MAMLDWKKIWTMFFIFGSCTKLGNGMPEAHYQSVKELLDFP